MRTLWLLEERFRRRQISDHAIPDVLSRWSFDYMPKQVRHNTLIRAQYQHHTDLVVICNAIQSVTACER